jgi:ABC-2 type transport system ATP-binding protein
VLEVRGASKRYGVVAALDRVDLGVAPGSVVGLVGPNGSGKTTLLYAAAGLIDLDGGTIAVNGYASGSLDARRSAAVVPDDQGGFEELTAGEYIGLVHALHRADDDARARAARLVVALGLDARLGQQLRALSRGLRRQVTIVAGLSLGTPAILIDEATVALDPEAVIVLREAIAARARGGAGVLVATQDLHFAQTACDEIVLLHGGRVVVAGAVSDVLGAHGATTLEDAFLSALGETELIERVRGNLGAL